MFHVKQNIKLKKDVFLLPKSMIYRGKWVFLRKIAVKCFT